MSGGVVTRQGREERWMLRELREPWALVARRAGRLLARCADGTAEARYIARLLADLAAHHPPVPYAWRSRP